MSKCWYDMCQLSDRVTIHLTLEGSSVHAELGQAIPHGLRYVVHILWLDDGFQVIFKDAREIVLQLAASEIRKDLLPVGWALCAPSTDVSLGHPSGEMQPLYRALLGAIQLHPHDLGHKWHSI